MSCAFPTPGRVLSPMPVSTATAAKTLPVCTVSLKVHRYAPSSKLTRSYFHNTTVVCAQFLLKMNRIETKASLQRHNDIFIEKFFWNTAARNYCQIWCFLKKVFLLYFITKMKERCFLILSALFIGLILTLIKINLKIDSFWKLEIMINLTWCIFCQPT